MRPPFLVLLAAASVACGVALAAETESPDPAAPEPALPAPGSRLPATAQGAADDLRMTNARLGGAIDAWRADGDPAQGAPPRDVTLLALRQQRLYILMNDRPALARVAVRRVAGASDVLAAMRALTRLAPKKVKPRRWRTRSPLPAGDLADAYRDAQRRFGVGWHVLAAVNFVETAFGKVWNDSTAGAQGPMQFMPATWRAYGLGGDVQDPRDAIMGAANYLNASGAPGSYSRALYAYNPSRLYVEAVQRYARRILRSPRAFYAFYSWQVFVRTPSGGRRRITGPR